MTVFVVYSNDIYTTLI